MSIGPLLEEIVDHLALLHAFSKVLSVEPGQLSVRRQALYGLLVVSLVYAVLKADNLTPLRNEQRNLQAEIGTEVHVQRAGAPLLMPESTLPLLHLSRIPLLIHVLYLFIRIIRHDIVHYPLIS